MLRRLIPFGLGAYVGFMAAIVVVVIEGLRAYRRTADREASRLLED